MDKFEDKMEEYLDRIPVLQGEMIRDQVRIWCKYCMQYHYHGRLYPTTTITHRVAHCFKDSSPYNETGYDIEMNKCLK